MNTATPRPLQRQRSLSNTSIAFSFAPSVTHSSYPSSSSTRSGDSCPPSPRRRSSLLDSLQLGDGSYRGPGDYYGIVSDDREREREEDCRMRISRNADGWNSVETFEMRPGSTSKAFLVSGQANHSPTQSRFRFKRETSPRSSIRQSGLFAKDRTTTTPPISRENHHYRKVAERRSSMGDVQEAVKSHLWENLNVRPLRANSICVPDRGAEEVEAEAEMVAEPEDMAIAMQGADITRDETVKASKAQRVEPTVSAENAPRASKFIENIDHEVTFSEIMGFLRRASFSLKRSEDVNTTPKAPTRPRIHIRGPSQDKKQSSPTSSNPHSRGSPTSSVRGGIISSDSRSIGGASSITSGKTDQYSYRRASVIIAEDRAALAAAKENARSGKLKARPKPGSRSATSDAVPTISSIGKNQSSPAPASPVDNDRRFSIAGVFARPRPPSVLSIASSANHSSAFSTSSENRSPTQGEFSIKKTSKGSIFRRISTSYNKGGKNSGGTPVLPSPREEDEGFRFNAFNERRRSSGLSSGSGKPSGWKKFVKSLRAGGNKEVEEKMPAKEELEPPRLSEDGSPASFQSARGSFSISSPRLYQRPISFFDDATLPSINGSNAPTIVEPSHELTQEEIDYLESQVEHSDLPSPRINAVRQSLGLPIINEIMSRCATSATMSPTITAQSYISQSEVDQTPAPMTCHGLNLDIKRSPRQTANLAYIATGIKDDWLERAADGKTGGFERRHSYRLVPVVQRKEQIPFARRYSGMV